jgi:hypothetical protein
MCGQIWGSKSNGIRPNATRMTSLRKGRTVSGAMEGLGACLAVWKQLCGNAVFFAMVSKSNRRCSPVCGEVAVSHGLFVEWSALRPIGIFRLHRSGGRSRGEDSQTWP